MPHIPGLPDDPERMELGRLILAAIRDPGSITARRHRLGYTEDEALWQMRAVMKIVSRALRIAAMEGRCAAYWPTEAAYRYLDSTTKDEEDHEDSQAASR